MYREAIFKIKVNYFYDTNLFQLFTLQDTVILPDLHNVHFDETCWDNPQEFNPERFLDENGQFRQNHLAMPFGLGNFYISISDFKRF